MLIVYNSRVLFNCRVSAIADFLQIIKYSISIQKSARLITVFLIKTIILLYFQKEFSLFIYK